MIPSKEGSGQGLFNLVKETLKQHGLDIKDCISNCTDGAASYHGQYKGLQSKIAEVAAVYVHTWCCAHVLNLVIMDTSKCFATSISMLDLLQNASSFLKVCYTRMAIWIEVVERHFGSEKMKRLKQIGETRWLGKSNAAKEIFGTYSQPSISTFVDLLLCFAMITSSDGFDAKARRDAEVLLSHFLQFETLHVNSIYIPFYI